MNYQVESVSRALVPKFTRQNANLISIASLYLHSNNKCQDKMFKPFRPPLLKSVPKPPNPVDEFSDVQVISDSEEEILTKPVAKKRRLLIHDVEEAPKIKAPTTSLAANAPRKPLVVVKNPVESNQTPNSSENTTGLDGYYLVLWQVLAPSPTLEVVLMSTTGVNSQ